MDVISALTEAYEHGQGIFDGISADQLAEPTPCPNFDVQDLVGHVTGVMDIVTEAIGGAPAATAPAAADPGDRFRDAAARSLAAWRQVEALDASVTMPWGETTFENAADMTLADVLAHTWDAAVATGQPRELPAGPIGVADAFTRGMLKPEYRADGPDATFGPEVEVDGECSPTDRFVAWLGRDPRR